MQSIPTALAESSAALERAVCTAQNFDMICHPLTTDSGIQAKVYYIDGFVKEDSFEKILENIRKLNFSEPVLDIPFAEVHEETDAARLPQALLCGGAVCLFDGQAKALVLDTRYLPERSISEPENDRVLRGARDGFVESLTRNTALLRRRVHDPRLRMELYTVGSASTTDLVMCYIEGAADASLCEKLRAKLRHLPVKSLNFGQQSLAEALLTQKWYNPFPKFRYTERPDALAAMLLEGKIAVFCDNSPQVMLIPTSIFEFMQETDDYYFPPLTSTYLRFLRVVIALIALFLTPVWYLLVTHDPWIPSGLSVLHITRPYTVPILLQLYLVEFAIDGLKLASLNTPSMLGNSLSIIGGLLLGDLAVEIGWFLPEVILYMAFVTIANFTQSGYELGYALKFMRLLLLALIGLFDWVGFCIGLVCIAVLVGTNRTFGGKRQYLYPLLPFQKDAAKRLFFRARLTKK